jgi:hypothetical protein
MYKAIRYLWVALALAIAPLPLAGQQPGTRGDSLPPRRMVFENMDGPVQFLLRNRVVLSLGTDQVTRLQDIDRRLTERVRPYVAQMVEIRRALPRRSRETRLTDAQRQAYDAKLREGQAVLAKIQEQNHVAMMEVREVLSEPQRARLLEILRKEREEDGGRDPRGRSDDRRN